MNLWTLYRKVLPHKLLIYALETYRKQISESARKRFPPKSKKMRTGFPHANVKKRAKDYRAQIREKCAQVGYRSQIREN